MVQEQDSQINKKRNWPLIIFVSIIVGIIVISLIAWGILYSKGKVGLIGTSSSIDIYCKDCSGESKQQCQSLCDTEFSKVNAPMLGSSMRTQKFGDKTLVICNCQGRAEDFQKILSGVKTNWDELMKIASEEGQKIQENWKEQQQEKRGGDIQIETCKKYYDQPLKGMGSSFPEFLSYVYPQCVLQYIFNKEDLSKNDLTVCDNEFVYKNSNDICKYMVAYKLKDRTICEEASFGLSGDKEKCLDVLNNCPSNSKSCIETLALISGDYTVCNRDYEKAEYYRKNCIEEANTFTGSSVPCEEIKKQGENADYCYMNVARLTKDESYCNNVQPGKSSRDCHLVVAVAKEDISVCNSIKVGETTGIQDDYNFQVNICNDGYNAIFF